MSEQLLQVIRNWTIRRKILTGFAIALLATGVVGAYAIRQLDRMHSAVVSAQGGGMVDAIYQDSRSFILVLVASGVILGLLAALFLARLIADPLTRLGLAAEQVSNGDLTIDIKSLSRDEIGWLEHTLRQMVKNLRQVVGQITTSSRTVATSAEEISASATQMTKGAESQSSSTEETSSTMVEMAAQMQALAKNAEALAANVDETSSSIQQMSVVLAQTAQNGDTLLGAVEEVTGTLTDMINTVGSIASRVHKVDEVSKNR